MFTAVCKRARFAGRFATLPASTIRCYGPSVQGGASAGDPAGLISMTCRFLGGRGVLLLAASVFAGCGGCQTGRGEHAPAPIDFRVTPPRAGSVEIQRLPGAGDMTRVSVTFARDPRLSDRLRVELDGQDVVLTRQAADPSRYDGTMRLDVGPLVARQKELDDLQSHQEKPLTVPIFRDRVLVERVPIGKLDVAGLLAGAAVKIPPNWAAPALIDAARSLVITDPSVIGDCTRTYDSCRSLGTPLGKWTFGYLMQQLAGAADPATFTRSWLDRWVTDRTINGWTVKARGQMSPDVIAAWPRVGTGATAPLDLSKAPFRLVAIVNRVDLAENLAYGSGSGGEARFVFQLVTPGPAPHVCRPLDFTVIFEYRIDKSTCSQLHDWAKQWRDLATLAFPSAAYNSALEAITEQFVKPASMLSQLRTNEIALAGPGVNSWDMREFRLDSGALEETTVRRTPDISLDETAVLATWVNANPGSEDAPVEVPLQEPAGSPFQAGSALMPTDQFFWQGPSGTPIAPPEVRRVFSLNTCNGCHAGETTTHFTHMHLVVPSSSTTTTTLPGCVSTTSWTVALSGFLTGIDVPQPPLPSTSTSPTQHYEDLERRREKLADFTTGTCIPFFFFHPLNMVH